MNPASRRTPMIQLPQKLKPWVQEELVPLDPKPAVLIAANHYPSAQAAWDAWTIPEEMICALVKTNAPLDQLTHCVCDLVSPAFRILASGNVEPRPFRAGLRQAKQLSEIPASRRMDSVLNTIEALTMTFKLMDAPLNIRYAAWAMIRAMRSSLGRRPAQDVPFLIEQAILASLQPTIAGQPPQRSLLPRIKNSRLTVAKIREWQCKKIRKHFPERPVLITAEQPRCIRLFGYILTNLHLS